MPKCQGNSITPLITYSSKENEIVFKNINTVSKKFTQQTRLQLKLQRKLIKALDSGIFACGIFVDLGKAFDTVNNDILPIIFENYGLCGTSKLWFRSYIDNRAQVVSLNGVNSETQIMKHGVHQGSVLGPVPLLFVTYINDLHCAILYGQPYHFASDTHLLK